MNTLKKLFGSEVSSGLFVISGMFLIMGDVSLGGVFFLLAIFVGLNEEK